MKKTIVIFAIILSLFSCSKNEEAAPAPTPTDFKTNLTGGSSKTWKANTCFSNQSSIFASVKWTFKTDGTGNTASGSDTANFTWTYDENTKILVYTFQSSTFNINKIFVTDFTADAINTSKIEYYTNTTLEGAITSTPTCIIGFIKN